jgi:hypothetical protein
MNFSTYINGAGLTETRSPGDGHCLLYSIVTSYTCQLKLPLDLNALKSGIFIETILHADQYDQFLQNHENLQSCLHQYLLLKRYNTSFGDLLPFIIANVLVINIIIIDKIGDTFRSNLASPTSGTSDRSISIIRSGDHYNGLVPGQW